MKRILLSLVVVSCFANSEVSDNLSDQKKSLYKARVLLNSVQFALHSIDNDERVELCPSSKVSKSYKNYYLNSALLGIANYGLDDLNPIVKSLLMYEMEICTFANVVGFELLPIPSILILDSVKDLAILLAKMLGKLLLSEGPAIPDPEPTLELKELTTLYWAKCGLSISNVAVSTILWALNILEADLSEVYHDLLVVDIELNRSKHCLDKIFK